MLSCAIAAVLLLSAPGAPDQHAAASREAESVREVVKTYVEARTRNDPAAIADLFTADADQLTSSGEWRRGRDAVVKGTLASSQANAGARTITVETVRFPAPDVALADGAYTIAASQTGAARHMRASFVMVRRGGRWRIAAIRNMLPAPNQ